MKDYQDNKKINKKRLIYLAYFNILCSLFFLGVIVILAYFFAMESKQGFIRALFILAWDILTNGIIMQHNVLLWKVAIINIIAMLVIGIIFLIYLKRERASFLIITIGLVIPLLVLDIIMIISGHLFTLIVLPSTIAHVYTIFTNVKIYKEVKFA